METMVMAIMMMGLIAVIPAKEMAVLMEKKIHLAMWMMRGVTVTVMAMAIIMVMGKTNEILDFPISHIPISTR